MAQKVRKHLNDEETNSRLSTEADEDASEDSKDPVLFGLQTGFNNFQKIEKEMPKNFKKALSGHADDHPFHKLTQIERNEQDPDSSFMAHDYYRTPTSSREEPVFPVRDWERKLKHGPIKAKNDMMRLAISKLQGIVDIKEDPRWKFLTEQRENKVWTMEDERVGIKSVKGEAWIAFNPMQCFYMITDISDEAKINDPMFDVTRIVEKYGQNTYKIHQKSQKVGPIYPRDFIYMVHGNELEDGTVMVTCFSVEDPEIPPQKGVVRGQLYQTGWILKPDPNNYQRTLGTFIVQVDLKGYIPKFAYTLANKKIGSTVRVLEDTMKDLEKKWGELYVPEHIKKRLSK